LKGASKKKSVKLRNCPAINQFGEDGRPRNYPNHSQSNQFSSEGRRAVWVGYRHSVTISRLGFISYITPSRLKSITYMLQQ
jgi:hypothetical protein